MHILSNLRVIRSVQLLSLHQLDDCVIVVNNDIFPVIVHPISMCLYLHMNHIQQRRRILHVLNMRGKGIPGLGEHSLRRLKISRNILIHSMLDVFHSGCVDDVVVKMFQSSKDLNGLLRGVGSFIVRPRLLYGLIDYRLLVNDVVFDFRLRLFGNLLYFSLRNRYSGEISCKVIHELFNFRHGNTQGFLHILKLLERLVVLTQYFKRLLSRIVRAQVLHYYIEHIGHLVLRRVLCVADSQLITPCLCTRCIKGCKVRIQLHIILTCEDVFFCNDRLRNLIDKRLQTVQRLAHVVEESLHLRCFEMTVGFEAFIGAPYSIHAIAQRLNARRVRQCVQMLVNRSHHLCHLSGDDLISPSAFDTPQTVHHRLISILKGIFEVSDGFCLADLTGKRVQIRLQAILVKIYLIGCNDCLLLIRDSIFRHNETVQSVQCLFHARFQLEKFIQSQRIFHLCNYTLHGITKRSILHRNIFIGQADRQFLRSAEIGVNNYLVCRFGRLFFLSRSNLLFLRSHSYTIRRCYGRKHIKQFVAELQHL